jgi:hypothetical protein
VGNSIPAQPGVTNENAESVIDKTVSASPRFGATGCIDAPDDKASGRSDPSGFRLIVRDNRQFQIFRFACVRIKARIGREMRSLQITAGLLYSVFEFAWLSHSGRHLLVRSLVLTWGLSILSSGSFADDQTSPVTIVVFGDSQAAGLARGLQRVLVEDTRYRVLNRTHPGASLAHAESEWLTPIQRFVAAEKADLAVVMFGGNDRIDMRDTSDRYLRFGTEVWRDLYTQRVERVLKTLAGSDLKITWCGNPIARSAKYSTDMEFINQHL